MSLLVWTAAIVALLGVLILVHELGHFVMAKVFGVKVLRFSIGFGPRLVSVTLGATEYRLSLLPIGGYVRLLGEDPDEAVAPADRQRTLGSKPLWQRYVIVIAGPLFNLLLPIGIYFFHYLGQETLLPPVIGTVLPGLPADQAGLQPGDRVLAIDGAEVRYWEDVEERIAGAAGRTLRLTIRRGEGLEERDVAPVPAPRRGVFAEREAAGWVGISPRFQLPEVGVVDPASPAYVAGLRTFDLVTSLNGAKVGSWAELERAIARAGAAPLRVAYLRGADSAFPFTHVGVLEPGSAVVIPQPIFDPVGGRRYEHGLSPADLFVYSVEPGSPADRLGLRRGDLLLELDGQPLRSWELLRSQLAAHPERSFRLAWMPPGGPRREGTFSQELRSELDAYRQAEQRRVFGARNRFAWRTEEPVPIEGRLLWSMGHSLERTGQIVLGLGGSLLEIGRGLAPASSLGGPLTIGYAAGIAAEQGLAQYLWLLALLSINIGLLNFLPVPMLDGGLLVFFTIELVLRRPPSARARRIATRVGLVLVVLLMALALKNDLVRFLVDS